MNLKNRPPVFVAREYQAEIEKLSKAALMDIAWDLAQRCAEAPDDRPRQIMEELRRTADIVLTYRRQAAPSPRIFAEDTADQQAMARENRTRR